MMFNFQENLSADATVVKTVEYFLEAEILGYIYDKLFRNVNFANVNHPELMIFIEQCS